MQEDETSRQSKPVGGVAAPADDGGHMGSYTVPSDVMDQSSEPTRGGETAQGSTGGAAPASGTPVLGLVAVVLVLAVIAAITLSVGL